MSPYVRTVHVHVIVHVYQVSRNTTYLNIYLLYIYSN